MCAFEVVRSAFHIFHESNRKGFLSDDGLFAWSNSIFWIKLLKKKKKKNQKTHCINCYSLENIFLMTGKKFSITGNYFRRWKRSPWEIHKAIEIKKLINLTSTLARNTNSFFKWKISPRFPVMKMRKIAVFFLFVYQQSWFNFTLQKGLLSS